ncbi:MAG: glycosyltransferase [Marinicaulis sp.]|nr:glycosyltransferase [Marinicaulis sp.]
MEHASRILLWGTADTGKPRTRIMLSALREKCDVVGEALFLVWGGIDDKSQVKGAFGALGVFLKFLIAYPVLIFRYLTAPKHDIVFVAYLGALDVIILWPFARLRGAKICWDAFLSLYDTVVEDRQLARRTGVFAKIVHGFEKLACVAADRIILDTKAHADYFAQTFRLAPEKLDVVWVGAEAQFFNARAKERSGKFNVLFYGQFIPLHGIEHIVDAARRCDDRDIEWTIIGKGQESEKIKQKIDRDPIANARFIDWIDYSDLPQMIADADLCLGVFGNSDKAGRVIPNKVFQIIAAGAPLVTRDGPGARELFATPPANVWLVEPGSADAILSAVLKAKNSNYAVSGSPYDGVREKIAPGAIASSAVSAVEKTIAKDAVNASSIKSGAENPMHAKETGAS